MGSFRVGVGFEVDGVDEEPVALMNHGNGTIQKMAPESDALAGIATRDLVENSVARDNVVGRDTALKADEETLVEPAAVLGKVKGTRVLMEPLGGGLSTERFVGGMVIDVVHPVRKTQGQSGGVGVDFGIGIETPK
jgi:hypothetical protein